MTGASPCQLLTHASFTLNRAFPTNEHIDISDIHHTVKS